MQKRDYQNEWKQKNRKRLQIILKPLFFDTITELSEKCGKSKNKFVVDAIVSYVKSNNLLTDEEIVEKLSNYEAEETETGAES